MTREEFERGLTTFDRTSFRTYASFAEADAADEAYWRERTPLERLIALEHIRQMAWGYDDRTRPKLQGSAELLQLEQRPLGE